MLFLFSGLSIKRLHLQFVELSDMEFSAYSMTVSDLKDFESSDVA